MTPPCAVTLCRVLEKVLLVVFRAIVLREVESRIAQPRKTVLCHMPALRKETAVRAMALMI